MRKNLWIAALTAVGVPAGLAATGGNVATAMTISLAGSLAGMTVFLHRWPLTVLLISVSSVVAFRTSALIGSGWVWPATAALVALALAGRLRAATITAAVTLLFGFGWDGFADNRHGIDWSFAHVGGEVLWVAAVLAAATAYRNTRLWQAEMARRLEQDEQQRESEARRRRAEERVDIARDLHDVVSHTLAVVGVHLNVALDAFDDDPDEARESLRLAQDVRGRAMADLKSLIGVLRDGESVAGLDSLERISDQVRATGVAVSLNEFGERSDVPAPVATAVHRVVQEALTNTVRHAHATRAVVTLRYAPTSVVVDVQDDGRGAGTIVDGHGIAGMRERVAALGGALTTASGKTGFTVRATIPIAA